jgi:hypothetical protein
MYHEIEGQLSIEPIIFDEDELIARGHHYPYEEIESLEITSSQLFSPYGILTLRTGGKDIPVPFARSRKAKLELAMRDFKKLRESGGQIPADSLQDGRGPVRPAPMDPYEELKKLKELLDLDIVTKEEFEAKKKQLLDL